MNRYDKGVLKLSIFLFALGLINLGWSITKAILIDWHPLMFSRAGIMVYGSFFAAIFFIYLSSKDLIPYVRHKRMDHDLDERTAKIITKSFVNAALCLVLGFYTIGLYVELLYVNSFSDLMKPLISPIANGAVFILGALVFSISLLYYEKRKNI